MFADGWDRLSPDERFEARMEAWRVPEGVEFASAEVRDPDIPAGRVIWLFDATDMCEVRRHLGGCQCFSGNVPGALFTTGSPDDVDAYVRRLIADVGGDGGFILGTGIVLDDARLECFRAFCEAGKRYGSEV